MAQLPRYCPVCDRDSIVAYGRRRKQAHDGKRDWIWVQRGHRPPCKTTFTVLPVWSRPYGHHSYYECRQQTCDAIAEARLKPVSLFRAPTILAWDFPAVRRILRLEANSP